MRERSRLSRVEAFGPEKVQARVPFPVRAHHAQNLSEFESDDIVERIVAEIQTRDRGYKQDVFGLDENSDLFAARLRELQSVFNGLPDDYPVRISTTRDAICESCVIGGHCARRSAGGDEAFMEMIESGIALSQAEEAGTEQETYQALIARPVPSYMEMNNKVIETDAATFRNALKKLDVAKEILEASRQVVKADGSVATRRRRLLL